MIEIIGKNGSGKTFLANKLSQIGFDKCIGYTTRPMRENEIDGRDYHFISEEKFQEGIIKNEWVDYKERNGSFYGIRYQDLHPDTILISGNTKAIEEKTGYPIIRVYLDCDMPNRYRRVKGRKEKEEELFSRFHGENFSFLDDFEAIFVDNNHENKQAIATIKAILEKEKTFLLEKNHSYLKRKSSLYKKEEIQKQDDRLLELLMAEEDIIRLLTINSNLEKSSYEEELIKYLEENNFSYQKKEDICVEEKAKQYRFDYRMKRS